MTTEVWDVFWTEIAAALDTEKSGRISSALKELEEAGFVASDPGRNPETGTTIRSCRYRLKDNYARFYLKYVEPAKENPHVVLPC